MTSNDEDIKAQRKGNAGENEVCRILSGFNRKQYIVINNVLLEKPFAYEDEIPTVQIDHIVVSIYGVFSIETKNYSGSIYGSEDAKVWTVFVGGKKYQMQNPLRQNHAHTKTLQSILSSNAKEIGINNAFFPICQIIAFSPKADLRKVNVTGADIVHFNEIPDAILSKSNNQYLTTDQMEAIALFIRERNVYSPERFRKHVDAILRKKGEPVRQKNSWDITVGVDKSQDYSTEDRFEFIPDSQNRYEEPKIYQQYESQNENKKYNRSTSSKPLLIVTLIIIGLVFLFLMFCCCGSGLISLINPNNIYSSNNNIQNSNLSATSSPKLIPTSMDQIDSSYVNELKAIADEELQNYIENNTKENDICHDLFDSGKYLGECFAYNEDNSNELFFIYKIKNTTESLDNVNLRKITKERDIFIYIGFTNIYIDENGRINYNQTKVDLPEVYVPDFTSKSIYRTNNYKYFHPGYTFISDLLDDIEASYSNAEYNPGKDNLLKDNYIETPDLENYADYLGHTFYTVAGYVDEDGEEYNECLCLYYHSSLTGPVCVDFRLGKDYNTLSFKYTPNLNYYGDMVKTHLSIIDKDTFEVIYETDDLVRGQTGIAEVDVKDHENIRIQLIPTDGYIAQVFLKDIYLSD